MPRKSTMSLLDRLIERTSFQNGPAYCWLWLGATNHAGYGMLHVTSDGERRAKRIHRISYELFCGPIPDGIMVCHSCDENYPSGDKTYRACWRPDHLFPGDNLVNGRDMALKGRAFAQVHPDRVAHGGRTHGSILTDDLVIQYRYRHEVLGESIIEISKGSPVGHHSVWDAIRRRTWKHLD